MKHGVSTINRLSGVLATAVLAVATMLSVCAGCRSAAPEEVRDRPPVVQDMNIVAPSDGSDSK